MQARIRLNREGRQDLQTRLGKATATGSKQLTKRICALLFLDKGLGVAEAR